MKFGRAKTLPTIVKPNVDAMCFMKGGKGREGVPFCTLSPLQSTKDVIHTTKTIRIGVHNELAVDAYMHQSYSREHVCSPTGVQVTINGRKKISTIQSHELTATAIINKLDHSSLH